MKSLSERLRGIKPLRQLVVATNTFLDQRMERQLNIDTLSLQISTDQASHLPTFHGDGLRYETVPYWLIHHCLRPVVYTPEDVVFDVGCGLGRWICVQARHPVRKCLGVEISEEFALIARRNATSLRNRMAPIEILVQDAAVVDYSEGTIFTFFNPFGAKTMAQVLERIRSSLAKHPRKVCLVYFNPVCEEVFRSSGWLKCFAQRSVLGFKRARASLWTNEIS